MLGTGVSDITGKDLKVQIDQIHQSMTVNPELRSEELAKCSQSVDRRAQRESGRG